MPGQGPALPSRRSAQSAWRNPWVRGWIGLVVVVVLANLVMVTLAVVTSPGLVVEDYYERGRNLAEARAARKLAEPQGWQVQLDLPQQIQLGLPVSLRVAAIDERGLPVRADHAELFVYRPADAAADFSAVMAAGAPGIASVEVSFPLPGIWDLIVQLRAGDRVYDIARRIVVQKG
ncbi:MAG TPA: FixH family protein [Gammaproteobacteria bacterium]